MTEKFEALHANNTLGLVLVPPGMQAIGCKWVYKLKHWADRNIEGFKAKLIVKGYTQQTSVDYTKTFSYIVKMTTVRALIAIVIKRTDHFSTGCK